LVRVHHQALYTSRESILWFRVRGKVDNGGSFENHLDVDWPAVEQPYEVATEGAPAALKFGTHDRQRLQVSHRARWAWRESTR
jgi:hypothetical protein